MRDIFNRILPKLSNGEQVWLPCFLANVLDKCGDEIPVDMLDGIEAESGSTITEGRKNPRPPVEEIRENFWVPMIDIGTH